MSDSLDILRASDLGQDLDEDAFARLSELGTERSIDAEGALFLQHSPASHVYVVTDGAMMVERLSSTGRRQIVAFLFAGDFIGFSHNEFYEYNTMALVPSRALSFARPAFVRLSDEISTLKQNIGRISNNVLARALDQIFALGQKRAHERLCFLIEQVHKRYPTPDDPLLVRLPMTRQDLADYLGLTTETVSRALRQLKVDGVIADVGVKSLRIADADALLTLARLD